MPRSAKKARRLASGGRVYMWTMRHSHRRDEDGRAVDCRQVLTLSPQPPAGGGHLRIVFADGPGRYVPGGAPFGSGDVGFTRGADLNLHEPGAVRALLDVAVARGWQPGQRRAAEVDGWTLLEAAAAARAGRTGPEGP
ncbi:hypothetical protein SUDANB120_04207 [Streptomyces sp. enrichment culture]|uniref:hypothetical protein n=1 Tax=Streptomyces TaxID=1883 RepID=UPI001672F4C1|nr:MULTISPECIES: hypothetical protein [Streptomyces]MBD3576206.1 hypothetical protein [Streptomyces sp. KD18]GGS98104.1 hypothetical protein GCM10010286_23740 [Streptomyces toxytricini]